VSEKGEKGGRKGRKKLEALTVFSQRNPGTRGREENKQQGRGGGERR